MMKPMTNAFVRLVATVAALCAAHAFAGDYRVPRLPDGAPDLQGVWTNATATPVERAAELGDRRAFTEEEAKAISRAAIAAVEADAAPSDPNKKIEAVSSLPPVGNYNLFWTDRGMSVAHIGGEYRTSMIIEPSNGRIPPLTAAAQQRSTARAARNPNDGPEGRALGERCLLSFGSASGPPMLPVMYNSNYQIVQSGNTVLIMVEMVHDARIIRLGGQHPPDHVRKWMGDSIGRWEGDTLVVETTNFNPTQPIQIGQGATYRSIPVSPKIKVIERFTRTAAQTIHYEFTIEDPDTFSTAWRGEIPFHYTNQPIYEYACHEGNYALPGILAGAREEEKTKK